MNAKVVVGVFVSRGGFLHHLAVEGTYRRQGVAVVVVQRFGGALNLNIHLHALVLDGVFTNDGGRVRADKLVTLPVSIYSSLATAWEVIDMETQFARRAFLRGVTSSAAVTFLGSTGLLVAKPALAQESVRGSRKYGIKACVFDMYGTVLDVHGTWMRESEKILKPRGITLDWLKFATALFQEYPKSIVAIREGKVPWANTDVLFRQNLERILPTFGVKDQPKEVLEQLHQIWHRLEAWPDVTPGMEALRKTVFIATCSNGDISMMADVARHNNIHFDALLGAEYARNYKPAPQVYIMTAEALGLKTSEVLFIGGAGHTSDFQGAADTGMKTGSVARPDEGGVKGRGVTVPTFKVDVAANDLIDLAAKISA
jgi:2-haloacid dehalogenase